MKSLSIRQKAIVIGVIGGLKEPALILVQEMEHGLLAGDVLLLIFDFFFLASFTGLIIGIHAYALMALWQRNKQLLKLLFLVMGLCFGAFIYLYANPAGQCEASAPANNSCVIGADIGGGILLLILMAISTGTAAFLASRSKNVLIGSVGQIPVTNIG
jgi:hypothetical protein